MSEKLFSTGNSSRTYSRPSATVGTITNEVPNSLINYNAHALEDFSGEEKSWRKYRKILMQYKHDPLKFDAEYARLRDEILKY